VYNLSRPRLRLIGIEQYEDWLSFFLCFVHIRRPVYYSEVRPPKELGSSGSGRDDSLSRGHPCCRVPQYYYYYYNCYYYCYYYYYYYYYYY